MQSLPLSVLLAKHRPAARLLGADRVTVSADRRDEFNAALDLRELGILEVELLPVELPPYPRLMGKREVRVARLPQGIMAWLEWEFSRGKPDELRVSQMGHFVVDGVHIVLPELADPALVKSLKMGSRPLMMGLDEQCISASQTLTPPIHYVADLALLGSGDFHVALRHHRRRILADAPPGQRPSGIPFPGARPSFRLSVPLEGLVWEDLSAYEDPRLDDQVTLRLPWADAALVTFRELGLTQQTTGRPNRAGRVFQALLKGRGTCTADDLQTTEKALAEAAADLRDAFMEHIRIPGPPFHERVGGQLRARFACFPRGTSRFA
jgi:hypothetical protein